MKHLANLILILLLLSAFASAKEINLEIMPFSDEGVCVNKTVIINATDKDKGTEVPKVQIDVYLKDRKVWNTQTNEDGLASFKPTEEGTYRVNAEKARYKSIDEYFGARVCVTVTTSTSTTSTTTSTSTTSTLSCLYDSECVVCGSECTYAVTAADACKNNTASTCACEAGSCRTITTTTIPTTSTVTTTVETTTTIPKKEESSTTTLAGAAVALIILIAIALYAVNRGTEAQGKQNKLGGGRNDISKPTGKTRLERV